MGQVLSYLGAEIALTLVILRALRNGLWEAPYRSVLIRILLFDSGRWFCTAGVAGGLHDVFASDGLGLLLLAGAFFLPFWVLPLAVSVPTDDPPHAVPRG